jgi:DNA-binding response OmpR family regulator
LRRYLEAWGADVSAAVNVKEADTYLSREVPTVTAILSLSLPKWSGLTRIASVGQVPTSRLRFELIR